MTTWIDGKSHAQQLRDRLTDQVTQLREMHGVIPGLAVLLAGEDPASAVYVRNKTVQAEAVGLRSVVHRFPADLTQASLLERIHRLNQDPSVHGILVQLPLPDHINEQEVIRSIAPEKDVDGFHPVNAGLLASGSDGITPCTALGCMLLLKHHLNDLRGLKALVIGRSNIVGKPLAQLLLREHCTVTLAHSHTRDLIGECGQADILVSAVGRAGLIQGEWIKNGATVIDVGINRIESDEQVRLVGDVDQQSAARRAGSLTPVPGGVGPMTIACLLLNTWEAACRQHGIPIPDKARLNLANSHSVSNDSQACPGRSSPTPVSGD